MKKCKINDFIEVTFRAGRSCDEFGRAMPFWTGFVQYKYEGQKVKVCSVQTLGTGTVGLARSLTH